jgi:hypothetical protein
MGVQSQMRLLPMGNGETKKAVRVFTCYGFFIVGLNTPSRHQYGVHEWEGNEEPRGTA